MQYLFNKNCFSIDARYFIECMPCIGQECDIMPSEFCMYGEYRDICGRRHCAKVRENYLNIYLRPYYAIS